MPRWSVTSWGEFAADDDELIRDAVMAHAHDGCGWSFPGEPRPRPFTVVS